MTSGIAFVAVLSLVVLSSCVSAQEKVSNFSGTWILDTNRSKLDEHDRIQSLTMTVTQTKTEIRVDSSLKLIPHDPAFMGGPMVRPLEQNTSNNYSLEGKETKGEIPAPFGPQPAALKAKFDGGKLYLSQTYGDPVVISKETWTLSAGGKVLTIDRVATPGRASTLVFNKKL